MKWDVSSYELNIIESIAKRAVAIATDAGVDYDIVTALMDITACHCNGCPLKLAELEKADDGNFSHDIFGIRRHIDRRTGELGDCFLPRFSV